MLNKQKIDELVVLNIARLARIELTTSEKERYNRELSAILEYIDKLDEVDSARTPPTSHPLEGLKNVFRKDHVRQSLTTEEALQNAPKRHGDFFSVPKIIE